MTQRIQGVLFDLGETLLNFGKVDTRSLFEDGARLTYNYIASLGCSLPSLPKYYRRHYRQIRWSVVKSRVTRREFDVTTTIVKYGPKVGREFTPAEIDELAWLWYEPLRRRGTVEPGAREMLERLRDAGLKLGLVSNTFVPGVALDRHLAQEGLLDLLPVRIYSCNVRYRKPNRRIFDLALQEAGLDAGKTLFVGDSAWADVHGANQAGLISVLKGPQGKGRHGRHGRKRIHPRHCITSLDELPELVAAYEAGSPPMTSVPL